MTSNGTFQTHNHRALPQLPVSVYTEAAISRCENVATPAGKQAFHTVYIYLFRFD